MKRRRQSKKLTAGRDVKIIARPTLPRLSKLTFPTRNPYAPLRQKLAALSDFDNRQSHRRQRGIRAPAPLLISGYRAPVQTRTNGALRALTSFKIPESSVVCVRRTTRREVLFAKGGAGSGKRLHKKDVRRNASSTISCRKRRSR